jgi:hypothetical protein
MTTNGQPTAHTQRIEERPTREIARQQIWLPETCPSNGSPPREEPRKLKHIVKVENAARMNGPFSIEADTTEDLERFFKDVCNWESEYIGLLFSSSRSGTPQRKYFHGKIDPSIETIYVRLYIKKHPPLPRGIASN